ncbi:uncharacterized protein LOC126661264 isoform X2 [Mercurialis annua]|uniref:uncharacterized protein LOC126661264 isoform X2 n=1 Tax=Mercurialis annua TaxID=3986 RepID=UPI00215F142F|nr:uncharacterized protein LOC126661264 isoform X2 [Mercurialis annua]
MDDVCGGTVVESCIETVVGDFVVSGESAKSQVIERVGAAEGGSCNGEEVMVAATGSDGHVDGVRIPDSGDGGCGGNSSQGGPNERDSEKDWKDLGVGGQSGDSDLVALDLGTGNEAGKSSVFPEFNEGKLEEGATAIMEISDVGNGTAECSTPRGVEGGDESDVRVGSAVEGSISGDIQAVDEKMEIVAEEGSLEGELEKEDVITREIKPSENETQDQRVKLENGVGGSSAVVDSLVGETQISIAAENSELAETATNQPKEINGNGGNALQVLETQKVGVLHDEVWNPGIEITDAAASSAVVEDLRADTQIIEKESAVSNPKVEEALEEIHNDNLVSTEKDSIADATFKSLDGQTQVAVDGEIASMDNEDIGSPNIEDLQFSQQPTQVVGGDIMGTEDKLHLNSETDILISTGCSDQRQSHTYARVHSDVGSKRAEQASDAEQGKLETYYDSTINQSRICSDLTTSCQPAQSNEGAYMDEKVQLHPNCKGSVHVQLDGTLSSSRDNQHLKTGTEYQETNTQNASASADAPQIGLHEEQEIEAEEHDSEFEQQKTTDRKSAKQAALNSGDTVKAIQARYQFPLDDEGEYGVSDLVWGKVRSHPWWPGQIFDPSDASEKAMKYHKRDCFLVSYFGDRTFAWNDASLLKPFRSHFSQVEKQSNSDTFHNAVDCALEEVSRRIEFGMACPCIPGDTYEKLKFQIVENAGIRQELRVIESVDKSLRADLFESAKIVDYIKALAQSPAGGADRLELTIATSQLLSFYRLKGYSQLPEYQSCGGLLETSDTLHSEDATPDNKYDGQSSSAQETLQTRRSSYHKRKHNLTDTNHHRKKEKNVSESMGDPWDSVDDEFDPDWKANSKVISPSSGKKRRVSDSFPDDSSMVEGRKTISLAKVSTPTLPKPSFKIGDCLRRVASQMTGSPSIMKSNSQKPDGGVDSRVVEGSDAAVQQSEDPDTRRINDPEYSSLDELLSQLQLAALDPLKGYNFLTVIVSFFSDFRNTVIMEKHDKVGGKRRQDSRILGSPETFEFEDMNDTYWTDRVIENGSEEQPPRKSRKRENQIRSDDLDKPSKRSNSRKRYSDGNGGLLAEKPVTYIDENAPAELVMHFPVVDSVPSEMSLNKIFKRFGPLREYETETDKDTNRARVVFKKYSDAEAAYGSAPKFNIFGSTLVNYQLNNTISVPFKTQPVATFLGVEDESLFLQF